MTRYCKRDLPELDFGELVAEMTRAVLFTCFPKPEEGNQARAYMDDLRVEINKRVPMAVEEKR